MGPRRKIPLGPFPAGQTANDLTRSGKPSGLKNSHRPESSPLPEKPGLTPETSQPDQTSPKTKISKIVIPIGSEMTALRFPTECRLKNKKDIQAVFNQRDSVKEKRLVFYRKAQALEELIPPQRGGAPAPGSHVGGAPDEKALPIPHPAQSGVGHQKPQGESSLSKGDSVSAGAGSAGQPLQLSRFCLVVSKKCGIAVRRNRIKRILREILTKEREYCLLKGINTNPVYYHLHLKTPDMN